MVRLAPTQYAELVELEPLDLSLEERLNALRNLDIFHPWESVEEKRLCRRCHEIITGRQIKIWSDRRDGEPAHLECPSRGCLAVPLDWIMMDAAAEETSDPTPNQPTCLQVTLEPIIKPERATLSEGIFGFLHAPPVDL